MSTTVLDQRPLSPRRLVSVLRAPWVVALGGAIVLWGVLAAMGATSGGDLLASNGRLAAFIAIAAIGLMLVVTTGDGAIDLSIPYTITLSVYVVTLLQGGDNGRLPLAILGALGVAALVGLVNAFFTVVLHVPAIVGTLSVGFVADSIVNFLSNIPGRGQASPALVAIAHAAPLGIPLVAIIAIVIAVITALFLWRTGFGIRLVAAGQNDRTALVSGMHPNRARVTAFVLSGLFAGIVGVLLCGYSNGAFLGIGTDYQLSSIAAVVLGGTLMSGGVSTVTGCLFGALFLTQIVTMTNVLDLAIGPRSLIQGLIIMIALGLRSTPRARS